jgi:hypothetical protein
MRTIRIKIYKFEDLPEASQIKAIEHFQDINTDYSWWDFCYDDFKHLCATLGITVDLQKTHFTGFYSQGDGCGFTANIDIKECLLNVQAEKWKEYAPDIDLQFKPVTRHMIRLSGMCSCQIVTANRGTDVGIIWNDDADDVHANIDKTMVLLRLFFEDLAKVLNQQLYRLLREDYECRVSKEAIIEGITSNDYDFLKDGSVFNIARTV